MTGYSAMRAMQLPPLLIVEDSNEDFEALQRYLNQSFSDIPVYRCTDGDRVLAFLYRTDPYANPNTAPRPGLILLDLNLPGTDGREVLYKIKQDRNLKQIPVVVFTTSNNPKDIAACYEQGANSYIIKPMDFKLLKQTIQTLLSYWFEITMLPVQSPEEDQF
ncbi:MULTISPECIES: response regulator [unclassified Microcoleus]|uniref:response regulator n=2 Tax=unclassified Microcoleus TaxID=2642155 RepID=UPI0025E47AA5|nr:MULTISPECIES: response regulator [unclassified Microcoleus]